MTLRPLVLVGMLDSPFVRRVAITLETADIPYTNLPLRTVGDAERFAQYSPLKRAPTLVLEDGGSLFDSHIILAYLAEHSAKVAALMPAGTAQRLSCYQVMGAATGLADKAVSALYEKIFHTPAQRHPGLLTRLRGQLEDTLAWLEARAPAGAFLSGSELSQADVAVGTAVRFTSEAHPDVVNLQRYPRVRAWWERLENLPAFRKTYLQLEPPEG